MTEREKFLAKLAPHITHDELEKVLAAYMFAKYGHAKQRRDCGRRYFEHPRAVANIIIDELKINNDWEIIVTALLHDILEDSYILNEHALEVNFGTRVAMWVTLLTKIPNIDYHKRLVVCSIWQVILVKLADRLHNMRSLPICSIEKQIRYRRETKNDYIPLAQKLVTLLPEKDAWRGEYLKTEIEKLI